MTLTIGGRGPLLLTDVVATGAFTVSANTFDTIVAAGASCTLIVTFKPTASSKCTGTLTLTDNATTSPQSVALFGTGTALTAAPSGSGTLSVIAGCSGTLQVNTPVSPTSPVTYR